MLRIMQIHLMTGACAVLLLTVGCGRSDGPETGIVAGAVTFEGTPFSEGQVDFFSSSTGDGAMVPLAADGTFAIDTPLRVGEYKVSVRPPSVIPGQPYPESRIPKKYQRPSTSGLTVIVEKGKNTCQFDL